jgi:hypothetical protein
MDYHTKYEYLIVSHRLFRKYEVLTNVTRFHICSTIRRIISSMDIKFGLSLCVEEHGTQKQRSRFCGIWGLGRSRIPRLKGANVNCK